MSSVRRIDINWQEYSGYYKQLLIVVILFSFAGCVGKNYIKVTFTNPIKTTTEPLDITVSNVQVVNHQIIISGTNLSVVNNLNIKESGITTIFQIESQTSTSIVANTISNVTFAAGKVFDFIFSNAMAASTFTIDFSLCNSSLGGKAFDCLITPLDKQVLSYDQLSGKWKPRNVNGINYIGIFDASGGGNPAIKPAGEYYIISVAGDIDAGATILGVGDWIVSNGLVWQKIDNSSVITSVFGRTGAVTASLSDLTDINFGVAPTLNQYLKYNGTHWAPATLSYTETDPGVTAFAKANLPTCGAGQVLKGDGTTLSCVTDNIGTSFTGTANRAVITDGAGALASSVSVTTTILNYLSNVTSDIQAQINSKSNSSSFVDWSTSGVQTIDPTRVNLTTANRVIVTNASSNPSASTVTTTELGYLSGVTSAIQTQLNTKQGNLGTGTVTSTFILDGTITDADIAGSIAQSKITNLTTDLGNKQNTSTLASDVRGVALTGLSLVTNAAIQATDSILVALGLLQKQVTDLDSIKLNKTGGTLSVGTIDGVPNPTTPNQVANKAYVDSTVTSPSVTCPTGYILVPANTTYFPKQFCVAKYEMKNDGYGTAVSRAAGAPLVSIDRATARNDCLALGPGYDMISNDQWQTIALNIAGVAENWSTGTVTNGELNRGHSDNSPANALIAVTDDNDPCNGTGQTCTAATWNSQRRTHALSNGNKIWDFAGNVWEWVTNNNIAINGADGYISTMSGADIRQTRYGATAFCASPASTPFCGMGYGSFNFSNGAVVRGGPWSDLVNSGIFTASLGNGSGATNTLIGFRCVFVP